MCLFMYVCFISIITMMRTAHIIYIAFVMSYVNLVGPTTSTRQQIQTLSRANQHQRSAHILHVIVGDQRSRTILLRLYHSFSLSVCHRTATSCNWMCEWSFVLCIQTLLVRLAFVQINVLARFIFDANTFDIWFEITAYSHFPSLSFTHSLPSSLSLCAVSFCVVSFGTLSPSLPELLFPLNRRHEFIAFYVYNSVDILSGLFN